MSEDPQDVAGLHTVGSRGGKKNKHLIFALGAETFGIPLAHVKEVLGMVKITPVPNVSPFFKGVINLRGRIISIIDLKTKLSISKKDNDSKRPCILICEFGDIVLGSIVDDIIEVFGYDESSIEHHVDIQSNVSRDYITGIAKERNQTLTLLLDISKVLNVEELATLRSNAKHGRAA